MDVYYTKVRFELVEIWHFHGERIRVIIRPLGKSYLDYRASATVIVALPLQAERGQ
jgi:hypothetical protein